MKLERTGHGPTEPTRPPQGGASLERLLRETDALLDDTQRRYLDATGGSAPAREVARRSPEKPPPPPTAYGRNGAIARATRDTTHTDIAILDPVIQGRVLHGELSTEVTSPPNPRSKVLVIDLSREGTSRRLFAKTREEGAPVADVGISLHGGIIGSLTPDKQLDIVAELTGRRNEATRVAARTNLARISRAIAPEVQAGEKSESPPPSEVHRGIKDLFDLDVLDSDTSTRLHKAFPDEYRDAGTQAVLRELNDTLDGLAGPSSDSSRREYNVDPQTPGQEVVRLERHLPGGGDFNLSSEMVLRALPRYIEGLPVAERPSSVVIVGIENLGHMTDGNVLLNVYRACAARGIKTVFAGEEAVFGEGAVIAGRMGGAGRAERFSGIAGKEPERMQVTGRNASVHVNVGTASDGGTTLTYKRSGDVESAGTSGSRNRSGGTTFDAGVGVGWRSEEKAPSGAMQALGTREIAVFDANKRVIGVYDAITGLYVRPLVPDNKGQLTPDEGRIRAEYEAELGRLDGEAAASPQHPAKPELPPRKLPDWEKAQKLRAKWWHEEGSRVAVGRTTGAANRIYERWCVEQWREEMKTTGETWEAWRKNHGLKK